MKICISSSGDSLDSLVDPRFGRCLYFIFVDLDKDKVNVVPNSGVNAMRGAGVQAAQTVADEGAEAVVTGNIGPNSFNFLKSSGVKIFQASPSMKIKKAIEEFKKGNLEELTESFGRYGQGRGFGRRRL